ncbi:hypothetical protein [Celeribacter indicus]|nr:hypothetical protein [Celeribacter indicus]
MKAIFAFVAALAFAVAGPLLAPDFRGYRPHDFPVPQLNAPIQPARYAFAIWGVIYVWLVVSTGFGLLRRHSAEDWDAHRWPLIAALVIGTPWLTVATLSPLLATIMIFVMLVCALVALEKSPVLDPWLARAPIALFAGWLTAAAFVSLSLIGSGYKIIYGQIGWAYFGMLGALIFAVVGCRMRPDAPLYPVGVAWGLLGIAVNNWNDRWGIVAVALLSVLWLLAYALRGWRRHEMEPFHG